MKVNPTHNATIYVGRKVRATGEVLPTALGVETVQRFVDEEKLCVTVTDTNYLYTGGCEPGLIIGLINYARFDSAPGKYDDAAIRLALKLKAVYLQLGVSVVLPNETLYLGDDEAARG